MGDKGSVATAGPGTVVLNVTVKETTRKIRSKNVLCAPSMRFNVSSDGITEKRGAKLSFRSRQAIIRTGDEGAACSKEYSELFHPDMTGISHVSAVAALPLWHERLEHVEVAGVKQMTKHKDID